MWSRHEATARTERGKRNHASIREAYQVICDPTDTLRDVSNAPGLPLLGSLYPGFAQIRVIEMTPRQVSPIFWIVDINYDGSYGPGGVADSPLNERPKVKFGKIESDEPVDQDANGSPIVTANKEPIEGVTKKLSDLTISIERNYAGVDLAATYQYLHSVNSDTFIGFAPGVVRLTDFSAEEMWAEETGGYWRVHAGFQCRWPYNTTPQKAWYARVRHEGFRVKVGSNIVHGKDAEGQPVSKPILLKSDGTEETNVSNANWLEFQIYQPLPYNALGLL
jgi:hypothetical protein